MRYPFEGWHKDQLGNVISGGTVTVTLTGTTTAATVYQAETGATEYTGGIITTNTTDNIGYFKGWIDTNDYTSSIHQRFRLTFAETGFKTLTLDDQGIFPRLIYRYYADPSETDQGLTGDGQSIKAHVDTIVANGTADTIVLIPGNYVFSTSETVSSLVTFLFQDGAVIVPDAGVTLTIDTPERVIASKRQQIVSIANNSTNPLLFFAPGGEITPQWFGAVADASADDFAEITACITAAAAKSTILFPATANNYKLTDELLVAKALTIKGEGSGSHLDQSVTAKPIFTVSASNVTIENLKFTGDQFASSVSEERCIDVRGADADNFISNIIVKDCEISGFGQHGIFLKYTEVFELTGNRITDMSHAGILVQSTRQGLIDSNSIDNVVGIAGEAYGITATKGGGLAFSTDPRSSDIVISNNIIRNVTNHKGLDTHAGHRITFSDNQIYSCMKGLGVTVSTIADLVQVGSLDIKVEGNLIDSGYTDKIIVADNDTYTWVKNGATDEYYLQEGGSDPTTVTDPGATGDNGGDVYGNDLLFTAGTAGSLSASEWAWSSDTLYVRLADDASPDTKAFGFVFVVYHAQAQFGGIVIEGGATSIGVTENIAVTENMIMRHGSSNSQTTAGIRCLNNTKNARFSDNIVWNCANNGIYLNDDNVGFSITGNIIETPWSDFASQGNRRPSCIKIDGDSNVGHISGNTFSVLSDGVHSAAAWPGTVGIIGIRIDDETGNRVTVGKNFNNSIGKVNQYLLDPGDKALKGVSLIVEAAGTVISTDGVGEDDLASTTIPADTLGIGNTIRVTAAGKNVAANGNKTGKFHFGSYSVTTHAAGNDTEDWRIDATIHITGESEQRAIITGTNGAGTTIVQECSASIAEDVTAAIIMKVTGECAHASDTISQYIWDIDIE